MIGLDVLDIKGGWAFPWRANLKSCHLKMLCTKFFVFNLAQNVKDRERQTKQTTNNLYGNQCTSMNFEQASSSDLADKVCRMIAKTVLLNVSAALISPFG